MMKFFLVPLLLISNLLLAQDERVFSEKYKLRDWQLPIAKKEVKTILDYYLLMPDELFDCETGSQYDKNKRMELIRLKDIRNGYIDFNRNCTITLFKDRSAKRDYIAVSSNSSGRGTTCGGYNMIIELSTATGQWFYRNHLFPKGDDLIKKFYGENLEDGDMYKKLPRYGLIIQLKDEFLEGTILEMKWDGTCFKLVAQ
ncbi:hypothetical protein [Flammeovirga aprica]|uniref:Uncharacterized protein n=1 Tax=Flammeovirga aprica JL-4 TaxID=694437 RepID=A0A7X9RZI8_9BACT|nr:hypothetical protein [Flammeovirga aprica]NME71586.1 hypothetical protein [Flammeovirga aprica JL-4]